MSDANNRVPPTGRAQERVLDLSELRSALESFVTHGQLAGALALVTQRDGATAELSVGVANPVSGQRFDTRTVIRLHSMSKPLAATAFLTLVDEGRVALDTPLAAVLPEFTEMNVAGERGPSRALRPIRMEHLLTHTSGLTYANPRGSLAERSMAAATSDDCSPGGAESLAGWAGRASRAQLAHEPGTAWTYGAGIDVLGRVMEVLADQPLDRVLRQRLFEPLGMVDTGFSVASASRGRVAPVLHRGPDGAFVAYSVSNDAPGVLSAGGGLVSTAADYTLFLRMLLNDGKLDGVRLLAQDTAQAMRTDRVRRDGAPLPQSGTVTFGLGCGFGLGGRVVRDPVAAGYGSPGTYGWDGIAGTSFFVDFEAGLAGLLVTQMVPWPPRFHETLRALVPPA